MSCSYTDKRSIINSIGRRTSWKSGPKYDKWMKGMGKARHSGQKEQAQILLETMLGRTKEAKEKAGEGGRRSTMGPASHAGKGRWGDYERFKGAVTNFHSQASYLKSSHCDLVSCYCVCVCMHTRAHT